MTDFTLTWQDTLGILIFTALFLAAFRYALPVVQQMTGV